MSGAGGRARSGLATALALAALGAGPSTAAADEGLEAGIATIAVPGDRDLEVAFGPRGSSQVIMYLHGMCGDPRAFRSWTAAATRHATLISMRGNHECKASPGRTQWTTHFADHDRRIAAAIATVDALRRQRREAALDGTKLTVIGYSQGANVAEWLAGMFPSRYVRVALIGGPSKPRTERLPRSARVLLMAGSRDKRDHLIVGQHELARAGRQVRYVELPGARHGEYGADALRVMDTGLEWLFKNVP